MTPSSTWAEGSALTAGSSRRSGKPALRALVFFAVLALGIGGLIALGPPRTAVAVDRASMAGGLGDTRETVTAPFSNARETLVAIGHNIRDVKTTASVRLALALNSRVRPHSIETTTQDGVVTLGGNVTDEAVRARAVQVTAAVPGVAQVVNQMHSDLGVSQTVADRTVGETLDDTLLATQVRLAMYLNRELRGTDVNVRVQRQWITLSGNVQKPHQRMIALETARETAGSDQVNDRIKLEQLGPAPQASDSERAVAAERSVRANANLSSYNLRVSVKPQGLVLIGSVDTAAERDLAGLIAEGSAGVPVENAVEICPRLAP